MRDEVILEDVLSNHRNRVLPCGPYSLDPNDDPIPYKRRRIALTARQRDGSFNFRCPCRAPRQLMDPVSSKGKLVPCVWPEFRMEQVKWMVPGQPGKMLDVYLGQCEDCGTIYWTISK